MRSELSCPIYATHYTVCVCVLIPSLGSGSIFRIITRIQIYIFAALSCTSSIGLYTMGGYSSAYTVERGLEPVRVTEEVDEHLPLGLPVRLLLEL